MSWFKKILGKESKEKLDEGLEKSKTSLFDKISRAVVGKSKVDDEVLDDLEEVLISSDVGVETTRAGVSTTGNPLPNELSTTGAFHDWSGL